MKEADLYEMTFRDVLGPLLKNDEVVDYFGIANRLSKSYSRYPNTAVKNVRKEIDKLQSSVNDLEASKESNPDYFKASHDLAQAKEKERIATQMRDFAQGKIGYLKLDARTFEPLAKSLSEEEIEYLATHT